jgi:methionyl aminopeptidase
VHGIPSRKVVLQEGDIVSIDFGVLHKGFYGDAAITLAIGEVTAEKMNLLKVTRESLYKGIEKARVGNRISDISAAVQKHVEKHGFSVVRQFVGHGIGTELHEGPEVPNYCIENSRTPRILAGMVLAIEPMVNLGTYEVKVLKDGWTVISKDRSPSAHFEHSIAVTEDGPLILSDNIH